MTSGKLIYWSLVATAGLATAFAPLPSNAWVSSPVSRTFNIDARQFAYSPSVLQVAPGDTITINLRSSDVVHGLYLDGYGLSMQAEPGQTSTLTFVANRTGTYHFRCNVTCGAMHPFMIGKLSVGSDDGLMRGIGIALIGLVAIAVAPTGSQGASGPL